MLPAAWRKRTGNKSLPTCTLKLTSFSRLANGGGCRRFQADQQPAAGLLRSWRFAGGCEVELAAQERRGEIEFALPPGAGAMEARDWEKAQALLSALTADEPDYEDAGALLEKATLESAPARRDGSPGGDEVAVHPGSPPGGKR